MLFRGCAGYQALNDYFPFANQWYIFIVDQVAGCLTFAFQALTIYKYRKQNDGQSSKGERVLLITLFFATFEDLFANDISLIVTIFLLPTTRANMLYIIMALLSFSRQIMANLGVG
ncbi:unnamed protein product, partial [Mesorhabditis spiculigera]